MDWSSRLMRMGDEIAAVEDVSSAEEITVRTYEDRTVVTLTYQHKPINGSGDDGE